MTVADGALASHVSTGAKGLDNDPFVVADEGGYMGGSRGWFIFRKHGTVAYEFGPGPEHAIAAIGHDPRVPKSREGRRVGAGRDRNFRQHADGLCRVRAWLGHPDP